MLVRLNDKTETLQSESTLKNKNLEWRSEWSCLKTDGHHKSTYLYLNVQQFGLKNADLVGKGLTGATFYFYHNRLDL